MLHLVDPMACHPIFLLATFFLGGGVCTRAREPVPVIRLLIVLYGLPGEQTAQKHNNKVR